MCDAGIEDQLGQLLGSDVAASICGDGGAGCTGTTATACAMAYLQSSIATAQSSGDDASLGLNVAWLLLTAFLVFVMQIGFAMLCAGLVRSHAQQNILLKNVLDACVGSIAWFLFGYGFAFGEHPDGKNNSFIGAWNYALSDTTSQGYVDPATATGTKGYALYIFQWAFAATASTITSGAVAERCTFWAYFCYSFLMPAFVYPVVVHSVWSSYGWLSAFSTNFGDGHGHILKSGAIDFAGSGVVHLVGGTAALVGAILMGPRIGRFKDGKVADPMTGHSVHLVVLGTFLLWFGWYGFNPGSQLAISGFANASVCARVAVTTTLAAGAGGVMLMIIRYLKTGAWEVTYTCNGVLVGLVGITAGCSTCEPWAAVLNGIIAAFVFYAGEELTLKLQIDDPVSAVPVHFFGGIWGVLFVGFFAKPQYVEQVYGSYGIVPGGKRYGWFYGGHGQIMLCQFIEVLFIIAWVGLCMTLLFGTLKYFNLLRVPPEIEAAGIDNSMHGSKHGHGETNGEARNGDVGMVKIAADAAV